MERPEIRPEEYRGPVALAVDIEVNQGRTKLRGDLVIPDPSRGLVVFAHGSGSTRRSPRNRQVAETLHSGPFATLLVDLLTPEEADLDARTRRYRFDIGMLGERMVDAVDWTQRFSRVNRLPVGLFGASTGAAAALIAAAERPREVRAVVSRGGRPDLAQPSLDLVVAPTLLIVGERDLDVLHLTRMARGHMVRAITELVVVSGASHLFEEPGKLDEVAQRATHWFREYLR